MRTARATIVSMTLLGLILSVDALAQEAGDYRSAAEGTWSDAATWETFDGNAWAAASAAPTGSESITIDGEDSVSVDVAVTITGTVTVTETGILAVVDGGALAFADGGTYEHARNAGHIPSATWEEGSTALITGVVDEAPDNRGQDYYDLVLNTPDQTSNLHMSLTGATIGGDVRLINSGSSRWYLTSADPEETAEVTINGDVIVEGGAFAVQGTGNALTTFIVHHHGNINVTGGNFSVSRGSQGNGSGTTTWYLYEGNLSMADAETQNSNPEPGNARLVFARGGTQQLTFTNVEYAGGDIHFEVADSTTLQITSDFEVNGLLVNKGEIEAQGALTFIDGGIYEHARDGGSVPSATWEEGSTALFTGITGEAPDNRGQDYYHLTLNTPDLASNEDLSLGGHTIGGTLTVINSGEARWRLVGGDSASITLMGDVIVQENGSLETQGTGSVTEVVVNHYGNVDVDGGAFSVSRGSQGSGTGTTTWILYEGNFSMTDAATQNSNPTPGNAKFVFAKGGVQTLTVEGDTEDIDNLSIEVADSTTLDLGVSEIVGDGIFVLQDGATLATAHPDGIAGAIQTTGDVTLGEGASFTFNGTEAQVTSTTMPATVNNLTIDNEAGVTLSQETTINGVLTLAAGEFDNTIPFELGEEGSIVVEGGSLTVPVANEPVAEVPTEFGLYQNYPNPFNPSTVIQYDISERTHVSIKIYDVTGREVMELVNEEHAPGTYRVEWNAGGLSSGVYFYRIHAGDWSATRSLQLVK